MNPVDHVMRRVSATNPVPDPDALTVEERLTAQALRAAIPRTAAPPPWPRRQARPIWRGALALASIVPVAIVVVLVLGVHHRQSAATGGGGSSALRLPAPGGAQTLLLIGSDHRAGEPFRSSNTDTMLLVRLDPDASTINVLSIPRDLGVQIPGFGNAKLNAAYGLGGVSLLLKVLRTEVLPGLQVNHIIDFNFQGFSDAVDALGCVYGDIDHRYINVNGGTAPDTDYSSINLQAGYQKLCGAQALQFVRFRHTDTALVRDARQQAFVRWVSDTFSIGDLLSRRDRLFQILGRHSLTDASLHTTDGLLQLFDVAVNSAGHPINRIPFPAEQRPCSAGAGCDLTATPRDETNAYQRFLGTGAAGGGVSSGAGSGSGSPSGHGGTGSVVADPAGGRAQATALGNPGLPVYYPAVIAGGSSYCSTASGTCRVAPNPLRRYANAYPRAYDITAGGRRYPSYRMTLVLNAELGEYYGVQGTTWSDPPILRHPIQTQVVKGRRLREYGTASDLSLVAFSTPSGTYWVSNTLTNSIPSAELVTIAASLRVAP